MRPALVATALVLLSGCMECGPQVGSVEASALLQGSLYDHQPALRDDLVAAGFSILEDVPGYLVAQRDDQRLSLSADGNRTSYWLSIDVPDKEFRDSPSGSQAANAYADAEAQRVQAAANETFALVAQDLAIVDRAAPTVTGGYSIC